MEKNGLTYRDYAAFARQTPQEIARDCEVQVFRATGPGGQGVNTTDSAVRMRHVPTGITVVSRESRRQLHNHEPYQGNVGRKTGAGRRADQGAQSESCPHNHRLG